MSNEEKWVSFFYTGQKAAALKLLRQKGAADICQKIKDLLQLVYCGPVVRCTVCGNDVMTISTCTHKVRAGDEIQGKLQNVLRQLISAKGDVAVAGDNMFAAMAAMSNSAPATAPAPAPAPPAPAPPAPPAVVASVSTPSNPSPVPSYASTSTVGVGQPASSLPYVPAATSAPLTTESSDGFHTSTHSDDYDDYYDDYEDDGYNSLDPYDDPFGATHHNQYIVISDSAKVRSKCSLTSSLVRDLPRGTICKVIQKAGDRYLICSPVTGWVSCKARDGRIILRNLKHCNTTTTSGFKQGSLVKHKVEQMCGTIKGVLNEEEVVVHFATKGSPSIYSTGMLEVLPALKVGDCFKVTAAFNSAGHTIAQGLFGVLTAYTTLPGSYGIGCIPDGKTVRGRDCIQINPSFVEKADNSVFPRLKIKSAAKIKGVPNGPSVHEAVQLEKEPEVILLHTSHKFDATILGKMWGSYSVLNYPLTVFEDIPKDMLMESALAQPDFRDGEGLWVSNAPALPRGYPTTVKGRKPATRSTFPKLLCRIQSASLHAAFDDRRRPPGITGLDLLKWGLEQHTEAFRRFAPIAGLIAMGMVSFNFNCTSKPKEMVATPYDALEGYTFQQLISKFGIDQSANGDLREGHITTLLLNANLAERYLASRYVGKQKITEEKIRQKYYDAKPELLKFLYDNFRTMCTMPTRSSVPIIEIYALKDFFAPSRFYLSGNVGARHLMSLVMGCNFSKICNNIMCPKLSSLGTHEYQPYMTEDMPTDVKTLFARPCVTCSLPQVSHPQCGIEYFSTYTKTEGSCAVCNKPRASHGKQGLITTQYVRRNANGELETKTRTQRARVQFTYRHEAMHEFVERSARSERLGGVIQLECAKCNTQHSTHNWRSNHREDLLLWAGDRKLNVFMTYGFPNETGVSRSIESTLVLATAKVPFDYEAQYSYNLTVTPRPYQAHAIDWMVQRENGTAPLVRYNAVSYANPEDGQYYYSDVYGEFREKPFSVNGGLLASEMGMGKTVMSLALCMVNGPRAPGDECAISSYDQNSITSLKRKRGGSSKALKADAEKTAQMGGMPMGGTLIITKATLWGQWSRELREKVGPGVTVVDYHSGIPLAKRNELPFDQVDFVVTNYDMLGVQKGHEPDCTSPLMNIWWHRILFDEIHFVVNENTNQARVTGNLRATNRWLLTGTPVQANHSNIIGLARAMYGVRNTDAMSDVTQNNLCKWFQSVSLRHTVLQQYTNGTPYLDIPPKTEVTIEVKFSKEEMIVYNASLEALKKEITNLSGAGWWPRWNTAATKLRQLASHFLNVHNPFSTGLAMLPHTHSGGGGGGGSWSAHAANVDAALPVKSMDEVIKTVLPRLPSGVAADIKDILTKSSEEFECPICYEQTEGNIGITPCGHVFCTGCIVPIATSGQVCPMCRTRLENETKLTIVAPCREKPPSPEPEVVKNPGAKATPEQQFEYLRTQDGPKIKAMIEKIREVREEDSTAKFVIFGQFERSIHVIEQAIQREGYKTQKIAGAMTQAQRLKATTAFASDEQSIAFILTVRSGSCGLNLTSANHVFLMDPCLNPALELQAIGRCHRISQTKPVVAYRFYMQNTIEEVLSKASGGDGSGKVSIMTPKLLGKYFGLPVPSTTP